MPSGSSAGVCHGRGDGAERYFLIIWPNLISVSFFFLLDLLSSLLFGIFDTLFSLCEFLSFALKRRTFLRGRASGAPAQVSARPDG